MKSPKRYSILSVCGSLIMLMLACSLPGFASVPTEIPPSVIYTATFLPTATLTAVPTATIVPSPTTEVPTATIAVSHAIVPSAHVTTGEIIHDVVCVDTAAENRAPYGDSYDNNLLERPFLADMTYVPDLDIASYNLSKDEKFYYVSIELVGTNPNNQIGIIYAVELDTDADGYGDIIIVSYPPHNVAWSTDSVQVVIDSDHDTGGLSAARSDGPLPGDGYDTVIFDGGRRPDDDPDLAWVRINVGKLATVQFAFKVKLVEDDRFMYGVLADGGLKEITDLDYVDRFSETEAGSPIRGNSDYPLKALFGVDNTCRTAQGFTGNWEEPQRCPEK